MRAMTRCASAVLMVMLWGCGSAVTLGEMKAPVLEVLVPPGALQDGYSDSLLIFLSEGGDACPDLSSETQAFFNDVPVPLVEAGHWDDAWTLMPKADTCRPTYFLATEDEVPPNVSDDVTRVRVTEGATTLHAEVQHLCMPRSFAMSSPAGGILRPGDEVELEWQPGTDELFPERIILKTPSSSHDLARHGDGTLRVEGNRLRFRVPQLSNVTAGAAELIVRNDSREFYRPHVTRCEGFTECQLKCQAQEPRQLSIPVMLQGT